MKLLTILILFSLDALSDDCSQALGGKPAYLNGKVYSKERKLLEDMANIDQGTFGICYAHSAAFLYDYYRFYVQGQKIESISSPFEAALSTSEAASYEDSKSHGNGLYTYNSKIGEKIENRDRILMSDFEGGSPENSLKYLIANGGCDHFIIDQMQTSDAYRKAMWNLKKYYYMVQDFLEIVDSEDRNFIEDYYFNRAVNKRIEELFLPQVKYCLDQVMDSWMGRFIDDQTIIALLKQASPVRFVNDLVFARCNKDRQKLNRFSSKPKIIKTELNVLKGNRWKQKPKYIIGSIDKALESSPPLPIEIAHCSRVYSRSFRSKRVAPSDVVNDQFASCGRHSAVVAGRKRFPNGECRYLVINWNGGECSDEKWNSICDEKTGGYWITKTDLGNATWKTTQLK